MKMSLALKLYLAIAVFFGFIVLGFVFNFQVTQYNARVLTSIKSIHIPLLKMTRDISVRTMVLEETFQNAMMTMDSDDVQTAQKIGDQILSDLDAVVKVETEMGNDVEELKKNYAKYLELSLLVVNKALDEETELGSLGEEIMAMQKHSKLFKEGLLGYQVERQSKFDGSIESAHEIADRNLKMGFGILAAGLLVTFVVVIFNRILVTRPIHRLAVASKQFKDGQEPDPIKVEREDEIGNLTREFNAMVVKIKSHKDVMKFIIDQGIAISSVHSYEALGRVARTTFGAGIGLTEGAGTIYLLGEFFKNEDSEEVHELIELHESGSLEPVNRDTVEELRESRLRVDVVDPKSKDQMAMIVFKGVSKEKFESISPICYALATSVANALTAVRLQQATDVIRSKTSQIRSIFEQVPVGICTIDESSRVSGEYSQFLRQIIPSENLEEMDLIHHLFSTDEEKEAVVNSILIGASGADRCSFDINEHLLPRKTIIEGEKRQYLELEWTPLTDEQDLVKKVMLCIKDISKIQALEEEAKEKSEKLALLDRLIQIDPPIFSRVQKRVGLLVEQLQSYQDSQSHGQGHKDLLLELHTLKGELRTLGLKTMATIIHKIETAIEEGRFALDKSLAQELDLSRNQAIELSQMIHGRSSDEGGLNLTIVDEILLECNRLSAKDDLQGHRPFLDNVHDVLVDACSTSLQSIAGELESSVATISSSLEQQALRLVWNHSGGLTMKTEPARTLFDALNHMVANSIAHGMNAKQIIVECSLGKDWFILDYRDDGRGLNLAKLETKLPEHAGHDMAVASSIFNLGTSTASSLTEISGRGVGMSAVRDSIQKIGGTFDLAFTAPRTGDFRLFKMVIKLPRHHFYQMRNAPIKKAS